MSPPIPEQSEQLALRAGQGSPHRAGPVHARVVESIGLGWHLALLELMLETRSLAPQRDPDEPQVAPSESAVSLVVRTISYRLRLLGLGELELAQADEALGALGRGAPYLGVDAAAATLQILHRRLLAALSSVDPGLRDAFEVGRLLSETEWMTTTAPLAQRGAAFRRVLDPIRLVPLATWLASIAPSLPDGSAVAAYKSIYAWSSWALDASEEERDAAAEVMRETVRTWRDLLLGRVQATDATRAAPPRPGRGRRLDLVLLSEAFAPVAAIAAPHVNGSKNGVLNGAAPAALGTAPLEAVSAPVGAAAAPEAAPALEPGATEPALSPAVPLAPVVEVPLVDGSVVAAPVPAPLIDEKRVDEEPILVETSEDGDITPRPRRSQKRRRFRLGRLLLESLAIVAVAVALVLVLRVYVVQTFTIPSDSMIPTLQPGDRVLVDKLPRALASIRLGDIIAFRRVVADTAEPSTPDLIKRVVGLPGERISSRGNTILLNGHVLREPWLAPIVGNCGESGLGIQTMVIPKGHYYVLGDCRGVSYDSRAWGTVPKSHIIGKVFAVVWRNGHPWFHWF